MRVRYSAWGSRRGLSPEAARRVQHAPGQASPSQATPGHATQACRVPATQPSVPLPLSLLSQRRLAEPSRAEPVLYSSKRWSSEKKRYIIRGKMNFTMTMQDTLTSIHTDTLSPSSALSLSLWIPLTTLDAPCSSPLDHRTANLKSAACTTASHTSKHTCASKPPAHIVPHHVVDAPLVVLQPLVC